MEIKKRQKTLTGIFIKFAILFCVNSILIAGIMLALLLGSTGTGLTLPANYTEEQLTKNAESIQKSKKSPGKWIPAGCTYGIYNAQGIWQEGTLKAKERTFAWSQYEKRNRYASMGNYYKYFKMDTGNICIVRYDLYMKYSIDAWNHILPSPEKLGIIMGLAAFIINAMVLSIHFAKQLNKELIRLQEITGKIAENDLAFEKKTSDIREVDVVMTSLVKMRDALKESLAEQWDMELQKTRQLAALAHDIKTPLTVIRGNAELLEEEKLSQEDKECVSDILENVKDIEKYLENMRQVLDGTQKTGQKQNVAVAELALELQRVAEQMAAAKKIPVVIEDAEKQLPDGIINCQPEHIFRVWKNILINALEYTDQERGIEVQVEIQISGCSAINESNGAGQNNKKTSKNQFMIMAVRDFGKGFSKEDLKYADQEFYSGDLSRHDRSHQGLGLAIARRFLEEQGGMLKLGNCPDGGARVECWMKIEKIYQ